MVFAVSIKCGTEVWALTQSRNRITDGTHVLSGLDFAWSSRPGLFPRQPIPMTATFSITVPDFSELGIDRKSHCAIEVKADSAGDVIARFYGDVTDLKARTRPGRPGVTVSVVAVDYMARLGETSLIPYPYDSGGLISEEDAAVAVWDLANLAGDPGGLWSSPTRIMSNLDDTAEVKVSDFLEQIFDQAVNVTDPDEPSRMIVSPVVDPSTGLIETGDADEPLYTVDTIVTGTLSEMAVSHTFHSEQIRRDLSWTTNKGSAVEIVDVKGSDPLTFNQTYTQGMPDGLETGPHETLNVQVSTLALAQDVALFYVSHPPALWQLDPFTIPVSRGDFASSIPVGLFPDWTALEGEPSRCCYGAVVQIDDMPIDQAPGIGIWASDPGVVTGWLVGARCRIAGGELEIDIAIRQ